MLRRLAYKRTNNILKSLLDQIDQKNNSLYSYFLGNDSLALQVVECLHSMPYLPLQCIKVVYQPPGWVVEVKMKSPLTPEEDGDLRAFMDEFGVPYDGKFLPAWYICTTWTHSSHLSTLFTIAKLLWSFMTVRAREVWKQFVRSL